MACLLMATFLWPHRHVEEDAISGASSRIYQSRIAESLADSASDVGATGRVESYDEIPPSDDTSASLSRKSSQYDTLSSFGVSSLSESPYTAATRSPDGLDDASPIANYMSHLRLSLPRPHEDDIMARIAVEESPWRVFTFSPTTESI